MNPVLVFDIETVPDISGIRRLRGIDDSVSDRDVAEMASDGSLAAKISLHDRMVEVGWDRQALSGLSGLLQPSDSPGLPPEKIVMVLGAVDTVTPYPGGRALAEGWAIPAENLFVSRRGHFSTSLALCRDFRPLERLRSLLADG